MLSADKQNIKQTVWTKIRSNTLLGLIWIQTVIALRRHRLFDCASQNKPTNYPLRQCRNPTVCHSVDID